MKLFLHFLYKKYAALFLIGFLLLTSCQMTEKLTVHKNGTGKVSFNVDASTLMLMMGGKLNKEKTRSNYDSIIHFKDVIKDNKDSILKLSKEKQDALKKLENFSMRIMMNTNAKKMNLDMYTEFKDVKELNNMLNSFQEGYSLASKSNKLLSGGKQSKHLNKPNKSSSTVNYSYSRKSFARNTTILDPEKLKREADSLSSIKTMFATSKYKLIYTFPKRIKKASIEDAYFSADGKTITIEKGLIEYLSNPKILDFTLEF